MSQNPDPRDVSSELNELASHQSIHMDSPHVLKPYNNVSNMRIIS